MSQPFPWKFAPGIQRDGTSFASTAYGDGLWCRWERGLPRKMFGYSMLTDDLADIPRALNVSVIGDNTYIHVGESDLLEALTVDISGAPSALYDRTPVGFVADDNNTWQFDTLYDSAGTTTVIIAHAAPNLASVASSVARPYYFGDVTATSVLVEVSMSDVSGGICVLQPYVFRYGDSLLAWSDANLPATITGGDSGEARVAGLKIIKGFALRGNGSGPAGLFWSLNSLIRASYVGGTAIFAFDTLSTDISVMSHTSICEYDGVYYWIGLDRMQAFNGVVREIPNNMNIDYFFRNLNFAQRGKIFVHKVPRFGEIWWCYPHGDSTECNRAIILNLREGGVWYDTDLPPDFRSCSDYAQVFRYPIMGSTTDGPLGSRNCLWQHEIGLNYVYGSSSFAIRSGFTTSNLSLVPMGKNNAVELSIVEWDAVQSGDLTITVNTQVNARAPIEDPVSPVTMPEDDGNLDSNEQVARFKVSGRNVTFTVESNTSGGDYQLGRVYCQISEGGERLTT